MSLYGSFIGRWLEYFPCDQLLVVRSDGTWAEPVMRSIADFLGVDPLSARKAAAAEAVRPESFAYNKEAFALARAAASTHLSPADALAEVAAAAEPKSKGTNAGGGSSGFRAGPGAANKPRPMLNGTRLLLAEFFEAHWDARFPDYHKNREPCVR